MKNTTTITISDVNFSMDIAIKYVNDGFKTMANAESNGLVTVYSTTSKSGWGEYTSEENANHLTEMLSSEGFTAQMI